MARRRKITAAAAQKAAEAKKAREAKPHIWIYREDFSHFYTSFEFHPDLQDYLEKCFLMGQKSCRVMIFSEEHTIDFQKKTRTRERDSKTYPIKRVLKSSVEAKRLKHLKGIEGTFYFNKDGFQQEDKTCNICLSESTIPTRLDTCGHVFCFMCIKSNYMMGMECPMCREEIDSSQVEEHTVRCDVDVEMDCPEEYIEELGELFKSMDKKDKRKTPYEVSRRPERSTKRFYWLFEAKNKGWFRYDPKNERYIEECYKRKMDRADMWICGSNMTIDFKSNTQEKHDYFNTGTRRIRRIKAADLKTSGVRGIAGIDTVVFPLPNL